MAFSAQAVGHGRCGGGHIGFHGVGQGVHAGSRSQGRRHAYHEQRVVNGHVGGHAPVHDSHFHMTGFVGDDAEAGHFRRGAGGGVHGHIRGKTLGGLVDPFVILNLSSVGNEQAHALAAVMELPPPREIRLSQPFSL